MAKRRPTDRIAAADVAADAATFRAAVRDVTPLAQVPSAAGLAKPKPQPAPAQDRGIRNREPR